MQNNHFKKYAESAKRQKQLIIAITNDELAVKKKVLCHSCSYYTCSKLPSWKINEYIRNAYLSYIQSRNNKSSHAPLFTQVTN